MSLQVILKNSAVSGKEPTAGQLANGEIALNYHADGPFLTCKDTNGVVRRIGGVWIGNTAPSSPTPGEFWVDTSVSPAQLRVYKDSIDNWIATITVYAASTTQAGVVELATDAETQTGVDTLRAVTPASLQSKISDSTNTTSSITIASSTAVKTVKDVADAALPKAGGTMTGQILGDDSTSASTPAYAFDGDADTGLLRTGPNALALVTSGTSRLTINSSGVVVIPGDFTVQGTTTTIDTQNLSVKDKNIELGVTTSPSDITADGGGITLKGTSDKTIVWIDATDNWTFSEHVSIASGKSYKINNVEVLSATALGSAVQIGSSNVPSGLITSAMLANGTIVNEDINASAAIAGTKISPDFGGQNVTTSGTSTAASYTPISSTAPTNGLYLPAANSIGLATNSTERFRIDSAGQIEAAGLGSAAAPTYSWISDPNTGIYSPGADQVAISTGGSGRLFVDSSGRVGIGGSPSTALHLGGSSSQTIRINSNTSAGFVGTTGYITQIAANRNPIDGSIVNTGTATAFINLEADVSNGSIQFCTTGTNNAAALERMRITSAGLVGIGTSSPFVQLTNVSSNGGLVSSNSTGFAWQSTANDWAGAISSRPSSGNSYALRVHTEGTTASDYILLASSGAGTGTTRFAITGAGNVGIGTSSPGSLLDLAGGDIRLNSVYGINKSNTDGYIHLSGGTSNSLGGTIFCFGQSHIGNANEIHFRNSGNQTRVVIDSSGRVGIGVTSPGALLHAAGKIRFGSNTTYYGEIDHDAASTGANIYDHSDSGGHIFRNGGQEALRIDSSKRLLVGTSTSASSGQLAAYSKLQVVGNTISEIGVFSLARNEAASGITAGEGLGAIAFVDSDGNDYAWIQAFADGTAGTNDYPGRLSFWTTADGASSPTERMRISSSGLLTAYSSNANGVNLTSSFGSGTDENIISGYYGATSTTSNGTASFVVRTNGNVLNANNSYAGISDIKLKENIVDATSQWSDIKSLQIRKYNFKEGQTHTQIGLIAQEVELVSPGLVSESPDRDAEGNDLGTVTKSVNYSVLYMKAVKALQEAMERIETLEAKVAALEGA